MLRKNSALLQFSYRRLASSSEELQLFLGAFPVEPKGRSQSKAPSLHDLKGDHSPMIPTELRAHYRRLLQGNLCLFPASVFDPISARIAQSLGFEAGVLSGSIASAAILGAPDISSLTLSELAEQVRRICRACDNFPIMVDADHGYGNAFSVMRTVTELEAVGACALSIEDVQLPLPYGVGGKGTLISIEEMVGKLRAAVAARHDRNLVIIARTDAPKYSTVAEAARRMRSYQGTGVDALMVVGLRTVSELDAVHEGIKLPLMLGGPGPDLADGELLASNGVRIVISQHTSSPHSSFYAAVRSVFETLRRQREGASTWALASEAVSDDVLDIALRRKDYARWQQEFLD